MQSCTHFVAGRVTSWGYVQGKTDSVISRPKATLEAGEGRETSDLWPVPLFMSFSYSEPQLSSHQLFFAITIAT